MHESLLKTVGTVFAGYKIICLPTPDKGYYYSRPKALLCRSSSSLSQRLKLAPPPEPEPVLEYLADIAIFTILKSDFVTFPISRIVPVASPKNFLNRLIVFL